MNKGKRQHDGNQTALISFWIYGMLRSSKSPARNVAYFHPETIGKPKAEKPGTVDDLMVFVPKDKRNGGQRGSSQGR